MERITRNIPFLVQTAFVAIGGGLLAAIISLWLSLHIADLSKSIPQDDLLWDYFIGLFWALVLWILLLIWPSRERKHLLLIWMPKIIVSCFFMLFYEAQLGELDAFAYFEQGIKGEFPEDFSATGLGTANIYRITYALSFLTGDSYRALVVLYSFLGLVGIWLIYKATMLYFGIQRVYLLYILALFPSLLFWPSILGKEPLQLLFLGIYTYGIAGWLRRKHISYIALVLLGALLITVMRVWWIFIIVTPLFGVTFTTRSSRPLIRFLLSILLMAGVFTFLQRIFDVKSINDSLLLVNTVSRSWAFGGTAQAVPEFNSVFDIIAFLPMGMFTALFRPMPWEAHNLFTLLASVENLILILLFLKGLRNFDMYFVRYPFITFAGLLLATWAFVYAFISYQNLGTALRFKSDILPFFLLIFVPLAFPKEKLKLIHAMESSS